jgi:sulfur relay (sulfurtransferase) DsrC/TusE family protein
MEDPEAWKKKWVRYIHVTNEKKLDIYNAKWKKIVEYLKKYYKVYVDPVTENEIKVLWWYQPLSLYNLLRENKLY